MAVRKEIQLIGRKFKFAVPLGFGVPVKTQGGAVIEEQARAQGTALSVYAGNSLVKLDVPVLFDSYRGGRADQRKRPIRSLSIKLPTGANAVCSAC